MARLIMPSDQISTLRLAQINILNKPKDVVARHSRLLDHLRIIDPDIITLQEVTDRKLLESTLEKLGFNHFIYGVPFKNQVYNSTAIASKTPIEEYAHFTCPQDRGRTNVLGRTTLSNGKNLYLCSVHYPWGGRFEAERLSLSEEIVEYAEK